MRLSIIIIAAFASGSTAFQPAAKKTVQKTASPNVQSVNPPITRNDMVAIRSPFWHDIAGPSVKGVTTGDYVVDRDYTVALTLIVVGIWLTLFGPSKIAFLVSYSLLCRRYVFPNSSQFDWQVTRPLILLEASSTSGLDPSSGCKL